MQTTYKCNLSDGPFCGPMDKYYRHSKSLYSLQIEEEGGSATSYHNLFVKSREHKFKELKELVELSNDKNRFEVGVQVLSSVFSFWLKFFKYDAVTEEHEYSISKQFTQFFTQTEELLVTFPNQVFLSQK